MVDPFSIVSRLWSRLTEPDQSVRESERRRHSHLLASLLVILLPIGYLIAALPAMLDPDKLVLQDWDFLIIVGASTLWAITYVLSRRGQYEVATASAVFVGIIVIFIATLTDSDVHDIAYLLMPILLCSVVLSLRTTALFVALSLGSVTLVPWLRPDVTFVQIVKGPGGFVVIGVILLLLTVRHRDKLERDRQLKLAESEARYRSLFESAFEGIAIHENGVVLDANPGLAGMLGYSPKALIGMPLLNLIAEQKHHDVTEYLASNGVHPYEIVGLKRDKTPLNLEIVTKPQTHQGRNAQLVAIRDITERKQAEDALRQAQKLDSMGLLAGGIAHDFNNLLTAIRTQSSLIQRKIPSDSPLQSNIEKALQSVDRATELTRQLLAYAGKGHSERTLLNLNQLIEENNGLFESALPRKDWLKLMLSPALPVIEADQAQIQQVLMNLVINAAEALEEDQGEVTIATYKDIISRERMGDFLCGHSMPSIGEYACLEVKDTGVGIDSNTLAQMFDPFFSTKPKGHGLGLSATLGIIRTHHGGVRVTSKVGEGTIFTVALPIHTNGSVTKTIPANLPQYHSLLAAKRLDGTVFLMDDEEFICAAVYDVLTTTGLQVMIASNPQEGIALFKQHKTEIDLVILDIRMADMTSQEIFSNLRKYNPDIKVIFSSGLPPTEPVQKLIESGDATFLAKPYNLDELIVRVEETLLN